MIRVPDVGKKKNNNCIYMELFKQYKLRKGRKKTGVSKRDFDRYFIQARTCATNFRCCKLW